MSSDDVEIGETNTTATRTITEADLVNLAGVSGDLDRLHTDAESMADSAYGGRIAHGVLVFSVATGLLWQSRDEATRDAVVAFYGVDRLRFTAPVLVDDTIRADPEVPDREPGDHPAATGIVRYEARVRTQDDEVVLAADLLTLMR